MGRNARGLMVLLLGEIIFLKEAIIESIITAKSIPEIINVTDKKYENVGYSVFMQVELHHKMRMMGLIPDMGLPLKAYDSV